MTGLMLNILESFCNLDLFLTFELALLSVRLPSTWQARMDSVFWCSFLVLCIVHMMRTWVLDQKSRLLVKVIWTHLISFSTWILLVDVESQRCNPTRIAISLPSRTLFVFCHSFRPLLSGVATTTISSSGAHLFLSSYSADSVRSPIILVFPSSLGPRSFCIYMRSSERGGSTLMILQLK